MWIVVVGDVVDGFGFFGPFSTHEKAHRYCDIKLVNSTLPSTIAWLQPIQE